MTPAEHRRKAAELRTQVEQLVQATEKENRLPSDEERSTIESIRADADRHSSHADWVDKQLSGPAGGPTPKPAEGRSSVPISVEVGGQVEPIEGEGDKRRCFGEFLRDIVLVQDRNVSREESDDAKDRLANLYQSRYRDYREVKTAERRTLSATTGSAGGYLIPRDFQAEILRYGTPAAIVRPRARVIPMNSLEIEIPQLDASAVTGGSAHFGGVLMKWTGETESKPATEPVFKQLKLTAHELSGYCPVSKPVLMKSPISIDAFLFQLFGESAAREEDRAFFLGALPTRPVGIHSAACLVVTSARGSATAITYANATSVWTRIPETNRQNATWVYSQGAEEKVLQMAGVANGVFIQNTNVGGSTNFNAGPAGVTLFNRPALMSSLLPALNTQGDFGCYDFSQYLVGDPGMMEIATSEHYLFRDNQIAFRLVNYVAGAPWPASSLTLDDGSTTVSPFVLLAIQ
jgi:HK97 family phage major capsid protein